MKNSKKRIAILIVLALVYGLAIGGTIAYLTAQSDPVTNTFTVGAIEIILQEHDDGTSTGDVLDEGEGRDGIKVIPGATVAKDPFVTVLEGSEKCYVYVKVVNNLVVGDENVSELTVGEGWSVVDSSDDDGVVTTLYVYDDVVDAADDDVVLDPVFTAVTIDGDVSSEGLEDLNGKTIVVTAYAHQSENTDSDTAEAAALAWAGLDD